MANEVEQPKALDPVASVRALFQRSKGEIATALPKHMTADRMLRIAMTELRQNPKLLECDPKSLVGAVIQASQLGLEPGSALGHAYLIPYWNGKRKQFEVQMMPGYRGFIDLARRSGAVSNISARAVFEGDDFFFRYGLDEQLEHVPGEEPGELTHVYAIANFKDGGHAFEVMTRSQVEKIRKGSKAADSGPWVTHPEEMARKTVVRRLFKYLPVSIEVQRAVGFDEMADAGISQENASVIDVDAETGEPAAAPPAEKTVHRIKAARSKDQADQVQSSPALDQAEPVVDGSFREFGG